MVIEYPNVIFRWHNSKKGICGIEDYITDIYKRKYGYNLEAGQEVYYICYEGEKYIQLCHHAKIEEVTREGVTVSDWMEKDYRTDQVAKYNLRHDDLAFFPWKREGLDLMIEPCGSLFEDYSAKELLEGTAPKSHDKLFNGKIIKDPNGEGLFYQHGGWRQGSKYEKNLKNIVKLGQMELDL